MKRSLVEPLADPTTPAGDEFKLPAPQDVVGEEHEQLICHSILDSHFFEVAV